MSVRGVVFDYGNTLVPYGRREAGAVSRAIAAVLDEAFPGHGPDALADAVREVKDTLIRGVLESGREVGNDDLADHLARHLGADAAPDGLAAAISTAATTTVMAELRLPTDVPGVIADLAERLPLALVSNYYLAEPIHRSVDAFGLTPHFRSVVVSVEIGWAKPHPAPFEAALRSLELDPGECVFVGDNLHADIGGAGALGMRTVHIREHLEGALAIDGWGDRAGTPDAVIERLVDLPAVLEGWE